SDTAGDGLDGLNAGGARSNHRDALAGEVDRRFRPARGVEGATLKTVDAFNSRHRRRRERTDRGDQEAGTEAAAVLQRHVPASRRLVPDRCRNPALELDVAAQVEFVGDVVDVAQG